ncbi:circadian clock-controlled protein daywake-like [Schistocerca serialis cubense]|uniref:circadian clock-controlled protein daywake-like n=1 Tax=Schistocerca serialis cubense TaxID=2023355 RepID=UPI00214DFA65|nr:circadian clock-controlled protein daywake-like [Schistocerca serialis cubense]
MAQPRPRSPHQLLQHGRLAAALAVAFAALAAAHHLPPTIPAFLKVCHRNDPRLNDCVRNSVDALKPYLKTGIPELSIPACEPLQIQQLVINQGRGPVSVRSTYSGIRVRGPASFNLKSVKVDLNKDRARFKLRLPRLEMTSDYKIDGRILLMPIIGKGHCEGNFTDVDATCTMQGERVERDGATYLHVKTFSTSFSIGHAKVKLNNLFGGDKELGDAMNQFLNENWRNVATEIKPVLEETISDLFKKFSNKIFSKFPMEQLLPP